MIFETFRQAIQNVWSNKLRTFLTMLGIIIGVMAVIVIVGLGNGMTKSMRDSFSALGTNTLSIQVWGYGSRSVSVEEMYDICQRHSDLIKAVSPQVNFGGNASGTLKIGTTSYRWSNMSGVDENFTEMKNYQIVQGRGLQYMDMQDNKQVCVIGDYLNRVAFGGNGVGQTLKIGANKFRVVGVLSAKVSDPTMQQGSDDDCVYLPYTTVMRLSSQSMVDCYTAMMADESLANEAKSTMEEELMSILKTENGYYVYSASEWLEEMNKMINMVIVILTGIASISLLVGGIGSIFFAKPLAAAFGLGANGAGLVPFLFLNAALYMLVRYLNVLLRLENNVRAYTTETLWMQACLNLIYLLPGFVTQDARAFVLGAVCSFAGVAVFYWRRASKGQTKEAPVRGLRPYAHIYRAALPYGIVLAPAAILIPLYRAICLSFLGNYAPAAEQGSFDFAYTLAQLVTTIQAGFSTYWGPYVYAHYRTEQERIGRIHDLLNLLIFGFFCLLVMFEDIIFIIFPAKSACLPYFPLMMLAVVFSILCEGTVYGNTIARKPFQDTIGTAVGVAANIAVCAVLVPRFGVMGAAVGLVTANATMFLYRTVTGQYYYRTIPSFSRTICGFLLAVGVAVIGVVFAHNFIIKFVLTAAILFIYCNIYRAQLYKLWQIFMGFVRRYLLHSQA